MFYKQKIENLDLIFTEYKSKQAIRNLEFDKLLHETQKATDNADERIDTLLQMIEGHDKLIQQLIPTINKQTQKIKKLEENYQMLVKVCEKIVTKIDPEWKTKTVNINTKKGK